LTVVTKASEQALAEWWKDRALPVCRQWYCALGVADKDCYHIDFIRKEIVRLIGGTFQPSFGKRDFRSIFRTVLGNSELVVTISGSREIF
jgi:hypothetical protein